MQDKHGNGPQIGPHEAVVCCFCSQCIPDEATFGHQHMLNDSSIVCTCVLHYNESVYMPQDTQPTTTQHCVRHKDPVCGGSLEFAAGPAFEGASGGEDVIGVWDAYQGMLSHDYPKDVWDVCPKAHPEKNDAVEHGVLPVVSAVRGDDDVDCMNFFSGDDDVECTKFFSRDDAPYTIQAAKTRDSILVQAAATGNAVLEGAGSGDRQSPPPPTFPTEITKDSLCAMPCQSVMRRMIPTASESDALCGASVHSLQQEALCCKSGRPVLPPVAGLTRVFPFKTRRKKRCGEHFSSAKKRSRHVKTASNAMAN
jgi:hypothetical protein